MVIGHQSLVISHRSSVIGHRSSVISTRLSLIGHLMYAGQLWAELRDRPLPTVAKLGCRTSIR